MRQNLAAIQASFQAAGVAFIGEEDGGAGVRFRKVEIEHSRSLRADPSGDICVPMRYRGEPYTIVVPRQIIFGLDKTIYQTIAEQADAVSRRLPLFLNIAETVLLKGNALADNRIVIGWDNMPIKIYR